MTTPNGEYVRSKLPTYQQFIRQEIEFAENSTDSDEHVFAFLLDELTEQVERAGLSIEDAGWLETSLVNGPMKFRYLLTAIPKRLGSILDSSLIGFPVIGKKMAHQI